MKVSENFKRSEFACKKGCGFDVVDIELVDVLEVVRDYFDAPVIVTSSNRCADCNREAGGSPQSAHLYGLAADIVVKGYHAHTVADWLALVYVDRYGIGKYDTHTHIDVKPGAPRRWGFA
jgi:uncharacterized protein YcbK (DUF882 family)